MKIPIFKHFISDVSWERVTFSCFERHRREKRWETVLCVVGDLYSGYPSKSEVSTPNSTCVSMRWRFIAHQELKVLCMLGQVWMIQRVRFMQWSTSYYILVLRIYISLSLLKCITTIYFFTIATLKLQTMLFHWGSIRGFLCSAVPLTYFY